MSRAVAAAIALALVGCRDRPAVRADRPVVTISVRDPELGAVEIEREVTSLVEEAIGRIPSVRSIRAESRTGLSVVVAELADDTGWVDAQSQLDAIRANLPEGSLPVLGRVAPDAPDDLVLAVGGTRTPLELTQIAHDWIRPHLLQLPGVGDVRVTGGQERRFEVRVDPARLDAMGVTVLDVADALAENVELPAGQLDSGAAVRVIGHRGDAPAQLQMRVVGQRDGTPIRVGDVAAIALAADPAQAGPLQLGIRFQHGVDRAQLAAKIVQVIRADLPAGVSVTTTPPVPRAPRITLIGDDPGALARAADEVARALHIAVPHEPTMNIEIDRRRAAMLGVSPAELSRTIAVALGQPVAQTSDSTDVVLQALDLERLHVRGAQGALVPLTSLVTRTLDEGDPVRLRIDRQPAVELTAPGRQVADLRRRVAALGLPKAIRIELR